MQRINTNLSPSLQCWGDLDSFLTSIVLLSRFVASFFVESLWQLSFQGFHLCKHPNFCQLWMGDFRKLLPNLFVFNQSSLNSSIDNAPVCFPPQPQLSSMDFCFAVFLILKALHKLYPMQGDLTILPLSIPW